MFKVPDWGNDIPKSDTDAMKLFSKKNGRRTTKMSTPPKTKVNGTNLKTNRKKKKVNTNKKVTSKASGHRNLSKDDHINNRILKRNLKMNTNININHRSETVHTIRKDKVINNKPYNKMNKNGIVKNKTLCSTTKLASIGNNSNKEPATLKRKQASNVKTHDIEVNKEDLLNLNADEPDKILMNAKRKKLIDEIKSNDIDDILFGNKNSNEQQGELNKQDAVIPDKGIKKVQKKKEKLKLMLKNDSNRNVIRSNSNKLRERMLDRLKAAQFRYLNEKLYTSSGSESHDLFKSDPAAFQTYHEGYQLQVKKWPVNPLDLIVKRIQKMPKTHLIADMGCGEAALSKRVTQTVRSFDLVATVPNVEACNMAHTPLLAASMDAVVFCLALMGTDLTQYLLEANRVLKIGGHLLIAEVESRFENVDSFSTEVQRLGFSLKKLDNSHQVFFFMEFNKVRDPPAKKRKLPTLSLKPCLYKRR